MTQPTGAEVDLLDAVPAAHMVTDLSGRIVRANTLLRSWVELHADTTIRDLVTPSGCLYFESVITPTLSLGGELSDIALELQVRGEVRHTLWAARRVGGDTVHWVGIDVTARRQHERELTAVQRRLARLQRLSSELLVVNTVEAIADVLLAHVVDGVKADRGLVAVGGDGDGVEIVARRGLATAPPPASDLDEPGVREAVHEGRPVFSTSEPGTDPARPDEATQTAVIPLVSGQNLGVVVLRLARAAPYSENEKELLVAAVDITSSSVERAQLLRRLETVARRNDGLSSLLHAMEADTSVRARAQRMADLLVPEFCDMAVVDLDELAPDLAGLRHVDPSKEEVVRWLHQRKGSWDTAGAAARRDESRRRANRDSMTYDALAAAGLDRGEAVAVHDLGLDSFVRIPLVARSRTIGTLSLGHAARDGRGAYDVDEFHGRLADACALSLDNARLYEHERGIAQQLQAALLPGRLPVDRRFSLHYFYQAGRDAVQVGGDWYDAFLLDGGARLALMVGDVVGGGVAAARTMGKLRTVAQAFGQEGRGVAATLAGLQRFAARERDALGTSVVYAEVDLAARTMQYGCAGHPPPVLVTPGRSPELLDGGRGVLLGVLKDQEPPVATVTLPPDSSVVLYTDGLVERPGPTITESIDRLRRTLHERPELAVRPSELAAALHSDAHIDDTCVLTLRVTAGSPSK